MTAWSEITARLESLIGGSRFTQIEPADLLSWFNQAQRNFAVRHTAVQKTVLFDGDGSTSEFDLPADFLKAYAVFWEDESMFLEPADFVPGIQWDWDAVDATNRPYGFILWPSDKLTVFHAPAIGTGNLRLYYWGTYSDVVSLTDILEPPVWSHEALMFYTIALSLMPDMQDTATINQWNTRVDSGRPVDNPLLQSYDKIMHSYHEALSLWPKQLRDQYYYSGGRD
ncbi:MAG: hypothetical protein KAJ73_03200 [Zetaproteobacteria bacterium]|nr:hypothetical protein [Zetaproteobacteria bacterium]